MPKSIGFILGMGLLMLIFLVFFGNYYAPSLLGNTVPSIAPAQSLHSNDSIPETTSSSSTSHDITKSDLAESTSSLTETIPYPLLEQKFAEEIRELNPRGPELFNGQNTLRVPNPERLINKIIAEDFNNLEKLVTAQKKDSTLRPDAIIDHATSADIEQYLISFKNILTRNQARLVYSGEFKPSDYDVILNVYTDTLAEFEALSVPRDMISFHMKEIELITQEIENWTIVRNADKEPLKALIVLGRFQKDAQEFLALQQNLLAYARDNNIEFNW